MRVTTYIQPKTDAALSKLGGKTRAENLRRAVALAEVAGELAESLGLLAEATAHEAGPEFKRALHALNQYEAAVAREAKQ